MRRFFSMPVDIKDAFRELGVELDGEKAITVLQNDGSTVAISANNVKNLFIRETFKYLVIAAIVVTVIGQLHYIVNLFGIEHQL